MKEPRPREGRLLPQGHRAHQLQMRWEPQIPDSESLFSSFRNNKTEQWSRKGKGRLQIWYFAESLQTNTCTANHKCTKFLSTDPHPQYLLGEDSSYSWEPALYCNLDLTWAGLFRHSPLMGCLVTSSLRTLSLMLRDYPCPSVIPPAAPSSLVLPQWLPSIHSCLGPIFSDWAMAILLLWL